MKLINTIVTSEVNSNLPILSELRYTHSYFWNNLSWIYGWFDYFQRDTKLLKLPKSIKSLWIKFALNDSYNIYCLRNLLSISSVTLKHSNLNISKSLAAARMVLQLPYRSSVSEVMHRQLHWLDVVDRVNYKIGLLVYKCLHGLAPGYLSDQCIPASTFAGRANMCSSTSLDRLLYVPRTKTKTLGPRGFYYASSAVWNSLPVDLRDPGLSLHSFRTKLKSHFFKVDWFFFFFRLSFMYFIFLCNFVSSPCAPTWCSLAGAYKCLYWIELNWIELNTRLYTAIGVNLARVS